MFIYFSKIREEKLLVAMDRADYGGSLPVPVLLGPRHPVPELHRGLEADADGGGGDHRDPVPGHHRVQPLPRHGRASSTRHR